MKKITILILLLLGTLSAASFDCNKASTKIEKRICTNNILSDLDSKLSKQYKLLTVDTNDRLKIAKLKKAQRNWLKGRNSKCSLFSDSLIDNCLLEKYTSRINKLNSYDAYLQIHIEDYYLNTKDNCLKIEKKTAIVQDEKNVYSEYYYFDKKNRVLLLNKDNKDNKDNKESDFIKNANKDFENVTSVKKKDEYTADNTQEEEHIVYINDNVISLSALSYGYYGGAHGNSRTYLELYDRNTGKLLKWQDIFENNIDFLVYVKNRVSNEIANKEYIKYFKAQEELNNFVNIGNFTITDKGLLIKFPSYSIAPYSAGHPELLITQNELKKYMNDKKYKYYFSNPNNIYISKICEKKNEEKKWSIKLYQCITSRIKILETNTTSEWNVKDMRDKNYGVNAYYNADEAKFGGITYKKTSTMKNTKNFAKYEAQIKGNPKGELSTFIITNDKNIYEEAILILLDKKFSMTTVCETND